MIIVWRAPAGYIAQAFAPHDRDEPGADTRAFLDVSGTWRPTREEAVASCLAALEHKRKLARAALERARRRLELLEADHASEVVDHR